MEKRVIKSLITEKQNEISSIELIKRPLKLEESCNHIFAGLRRAGKSYYLYQHIQSLLKSGQVSIEEILFINFEDERISPMKSQDLNLFLECYREMYNSTPIIYLDEIQNIEGWEKFVRRLADSKYRVFVTGSNAKMLSKEMHTTLGGRFIIKEVFPFSFAEYLSYNDITLHKNWEYQQTKQQVIQLFTDYFYYGGFAETFPVKNKRDWLNSLYQKVLLGDIIARNGIRNENAIKILVKKLADNVMQPTSLARLKNVIDLTETGISRNTLVEYLQLLEDAWLVFSISNFSSKISEKETIKKRYFYDNGLLNNLIFEPETKLLENLVAITLKRNFGELYFYHRNIEVDFYIPEHKRAIQVSYSISDDRTRQREIKALIKLSEVYQVDHMEIVTWDEESTLNENGCKIQVLPIWKWLLQFQHIE